MTKTIDALECRDKLLQELATIDDAETGMALWRAAKRYNDRLRMERADAVTSARPSLAINAGEETAVRDCW